MPNIRMVIVDITGIDNFNAMTRAYLKAIQTKKPKIADKLQRRLETKTAELLGASIVSGKIGQTNTQDYLIPSSSRLLQTLYAEALTSEQLGVEYKALAANTRGSKIGQVTLATSSIYAIPSSGVSVSGKSFAEKILKSNKEGYLLDIDPYFTDQRNGKQKNRGTVSVTNRLFNYYCKKDSNLKNMLYSKASTLILNNLYDIEDNGSKVSGTRLINLQIPMSSFNSKNFKAKIVDNSIVISLNDAFQRNMFKQLNELYMNQLTDETSKPYKLSITFGKNTAKIDVVSVLKGTQAFGTYITNSIKVFPTDTITLKTPRRRTTPVKNEKQKFIKAYELTIATRKKLIATMEHVGAPTPPDLKYRTGTFVRGVDITPDYKNNTIKYHYDPLYDANIKYGFKPQKQVLDATKATMQEYFARHFNFIRT